MLVRISFVSEDEPHPAILDETSLLHAAANEKNLESIFMSSDLNVLQRFKQ